MTKHYVLPMTGLCTLLAGFLTFFAHCQPPTPPPDQVNLTAKTTVFLLDSTSASHRVIRDRKEHFFEKIQPLDMCIQLKLAECPFNAPDSLRQVYKAFIARDVRPFSDSEKRFLAKTLEQVNTYLNPVPDRFLPDRVLLIKTAGNYYGPSVFYTRENAIIIPEPILSRRNYQRMRNIMLHELFHIISRYNDSLQLKSYALIGFKPTGQPVGIPPALQQRILLNPDGLDLNWQIDLDSTGAFAPHVPVVYSKVDDLDARATHFFHYLTFNLIPLRENQLVVAENGLPAKTLEDDPVFRKRITKNSDYIIHPDELMADNFVLLLTSQQNPAVTDRLTPEGRRLLEEFMQLFLGN